MVHYNVTSDMQGLVWGEPELTRVHMTYIRDVYIYMDVMIPFGRGKEGYASATYLSVFAPPSLWLSLCTISLGSRS